MNVRIHDYSSGFIEECPYDPFQNDELNVLFIGNNHYQALIPLEEYNQYMDNAVSEDDDEHKLLNEDELVSFQKQLLNNDNIDVVDEPIINEEPFEK